MKKLFLTLILLFTAGAVATQTEVFEDSDLGLSIELPSALTLNWDVTHTSSGLRCLVYHNDYQEDDFRMVVLTKYPTNAVSFECGKSFIPFLMKQVEEMFGEEGILEDEDYEFEIEPLDMQEYTQLGVHSYRMQITDTWEEETTFLDLHIFGGEKESLIAICGGCSWTDEESADAFSRKFLKRVVPLDDEWDD